jgi:hypothetical protein
MKLRGYNYKQVLIQIIKEEVQKFPFLQEIFDSSPFKKEFEFVDSLDDIRCKPFQDNQQNLIQVIFHKMRRECYEVDFMVNDRSLSNENINYSIKEYTSLISTIFKCIEQFIKEISPQALNIEGEDSFFKQEKGKKGQKNAIYKYALKGLSFPSNYTILTNEDGTSQILKK